MKNITLLLAMREPNQKQIESVSGGIAFFVYFATGYLATFAGSAGGLLTLLML